MYGLTKYVRLVQIVPQNLSKSLAMFPTKDSFCSAGQVATAGASSRLAPGFKLADSFGPKRFVTSLRWVTELACPKGLQT